ncbi:glutathione S-transferase family protein [Epibacterium ulvae]|uniref:glutathione S-transferase family protein n=1 Tax=Epibacterium ulvae TaxID=1156985 RepID=UPI001BFC239E|nr:glutathione S-transferase family protein [Epibacterium ulvae]MBT8152705.1 glutathione S-transferase family protein [Epibacterium ulvae]
MITFYGYNTINSLKIMMFLMETDLKHDFVPINIRGGDQHTPDFRAVNPAGKIPVIVENNTALTESNAILMHLARKIGWGLPEGGEDRLLSLLFYQASTQGPYFGQVEYWSALAPKPNPDALAQYTAIANRVVTYIEEQLTGKDYICGATYSIADIAFFPWLNHYTHLDLSIENASNIAAWIDRVKSRTATEKASTFLEAYNLTPPTGS